MNTNKMLGEILNVMNTNTKMLEDILNRLNKHEISQTDQQKQHERQSMEPESSSSIIFENTFSTELFRAFEKPDELLKKEDLDPFQNQILKSGDYFYFLAIDASKFVDLKEKEHCTFRRFVEEIFYIGSGCVVYPRALYMKNLFYTIKNDPNNRLHHILETKKGIYMLTPGTDLEEDFIRCRTGPIIEAIGESNLPYCVKPLAKPLENITKKPSYSEYYSETPLDKFTPKKRRELGALLLWHIWELFMQTDQKLFTFEEIMWETTRDEQKIMFDEVLGQFFVQWMPRLIKLSIDNEQKDSEQNIREIQDEDKVEEMEVVEEEKIKESQLETLRHSPPSSLPSPPRRSPRRSPSSPRSHGKVEKKSIKSSTRIPGSKHELRSVRVTRSSQMKV